MGYLGIGVGVRGDFTEWEFLDGWKFNQLGVLVGTLVGRHPV